MLSGTGAPAPEPGKVGTAPLQSKQAKKLSNRIY